MKRRTTEMSTLAESMEIVGAPRRGVKRRFSGKAGGRGKTLTKRQKNEVKLLMHREQELKYFFFRVTAQTVSNAFAWTGQPFDVPQGDTDNTRDGDRLRWCGTLEMNVQFTNGQGATGDIFNNIRFILLQWHPTTTGTPSPVSNGSDFFLNGPSGSVDIYSVANHDQRSNYTILYDRVFKTVGNGNSASTPNTNEVTTGVHFLRIPLTKARKDVQYVAGGLQGTNRLLLCYVSDSTLATHPTFTMMSKVFYRDS